MRYIYCDESVFGEGDAYYGFGCLVTRQPIEQGLVDAAMDALRADPDIHDPQTSDLDADTLRRNYFHACDDSKNAHSHLCRAIVADVEGLLNVHFVDSNQTTIRPKTPNALHGLATRLSSMSVLQTREPVTMVFEQRSGVTQHGLTRAFDRFDDTLAKLVHELPIAARFFPERTIRIADKSEPGIQMVDFMLWASCRGFAGKPTWSNRLRTGAPSTVEMKADSGSMGGLKIEFRGFPREDPVDYTLGDLPPKYVATTDEVLTELAHALRLIRYISEDTPEEVQHIGAQIEAAVRAVERGPSPRAVQALGGVYVKLFDMLRFVDEDTNAEEKRRRLYFRQLMSLVLRRDLVHGVQTCDWIAMLWRRNQAAI